MIRRQLRVQAHRGDATAVCPHPRYDPLHRHASLDLKQKRKAAPAFCCGGFAACVKKYLTHAQTQPAALGSRLKELHPAARIIFTPLA